jgi:Holliday junction resolvase RusA-like endonuclease
MIDEHDLATLPILGGDVVRFTIRGEPASKANSRSIVTINDRPSSIKSAKARSFEAIAMLQIPAAAKRMFSGPIAVQMDIYYASRRPDLDESVVLDVLQAKFTGVGVKRKLVRAGVYLNDRQVFEKRVRKGLDPQNPRVEIAVSQLGQSELL